MGFIAQAFWFGGARGDPLINGLTKVDYSGGQKWLYRISARDKFLIPLADHARNDLGTVLVFHPWWLRGVSE